MTPERIQELVDFACQDPYYESSVRQAIETAISEERERCAKIVAAKIDPEDEHDPELYPRWFALSECLQEITSGI